MPKSRNKSDRYQPTPRERADRKVKAATGQRLGDLVGVLSSRDQQAQPQALQDRLFAWVILRQHRSYLTVGERASLDWAEHQIGQALEAAGPTPDGTGQTWRAVDGHIVSA